MSDSEKKIRHALDHTDSLPFDCPDGKYELTEAEMVLAEIDERIRQNRQEMKALHATRHAAFHTAEREQLERESQLADEALATHKGRPQGMAQRIYLYTVGEEIFSAVVHGIGVLFGIVALVLLALAGVASGDSIKLAAGLIFGISIILEYLASTLYHALRPARAKRVFKILDHSSIYLLIAGTYTPFTLVTLAGNGGQTLTTIVWTFALVGIALEAFWVFRPKWVSVLIYAGMGWIIVFKIGALIQLLVPAGVWLLIIGGLCYTIGTVFYLLKKVKWMHSIWHIWVLAGTVCHFLSILLFVIM